MYISTMSLLWRLLGRGMLVVAGWGVVSLAIASASPVPLLAVEAVEADLVIAGGTLYDGSDADGMPADVAVKGDRIVAVGKFEVRGQPRTIDAKGLIVAPGFIDLHTHSDRSILPAKTRQNANYLMQGVATVVTGNCGFGPVDVGKYLAAIDASGAGTNVLHLVPHGGLRDEVMGEANRPPSEKELARMRQLMARGMKDGAWGMSTGLIYTPGSFSQTPELVALAEVVSQNDGIYVSHIRNEGTRLLDSLEEILAIGQQAKLPVHVSHLKASGKNAWGLADDALARLRKARAEGQVVTADQYPYTASSTSLAATLIPDELRSGSALQAALSDAERGPKVREQIERSLTERNDGATIFLASYSPKRAWQGKNLAEIAKQEGKSPLAIVLEIHDNGGASIVNFGMNEEEVRLIMREPFVATASDGSSQALDSPTQPHPRNYGCFPRKIGFYAIEGHVLPLAQAIRSASGLPADILRLPQRGYVKPDYFADVVVFDPKTFRDTATFQKPHQWASGVRYLLINGQLAVEDGKPTAALAGKAIRHSKSADSGEKGN
jgi:N-acyl-D-aspartate/D-glutamate deacylase